VGGGVGHQVKVTYLSIGVAGFPGLDDLCRQLARNRLVASDGRIDVQQLHGFLLKVVGGAPRGAALVLIMGLAPCVDKWSNSHWLVLFLEQ
jgi:hypothetical protein